MKLVQVSELQQHMDRAWHVSWSHDGKYLASCSGDKTMKIYTLVDGKWNCIATLGDAHTRTIRSCEWSHCGRYIASSSFDATTIIWEKINDTEFQIIATLEGHESEVKSVAWNREGTYIATCSRDKSVWIWEATASTDFECVSVLHGHSQDVKAVAWHPTSPVLFSVSYDDTIRVWAEDDDDFVCLETLEGHTSTVWGVAIEPSANHRIVSCSDDKSLIIWEHFPDSVDKRSDGSSMSWKRVCTLTGYHSRTIFTVDWSAQGYIATGDASNVISIFEETAKSTFDVVCQEKMAHNGDVNCVRWNPDGTLLASAADDGSVRIWTIES